MLTPAAEIEYRFVVLLRVSTQRQVDGNGHKRQREAAKRYIRSLERQMNRRRPFRRRPFRRRFYTEVERSHDGTASNRDVLLRAVDHVCRLGKNGMLIVGDTKRFSRGVNDTNRLLERIRQSGANLYSIWDQISTLRDGEEAWRELTQQGAAEIERKRQQTSKAAKEKKEAGKHWGDVPFAYRKNDAGILEPDPERQKTVLYIIEQHKLDVSWNKIAKELQRQGAKTKRGGCWTARNVINIYKDVQEHGGLDVCE